MSKPTSPPWFKRCILLDEAAALPCHTGWPVRRSTMRPSIATVVCMLISTATIHEQLHDGCQGGDASNVAGVELL